MSRKSGPIHYIAQPMLQVGTGKMQKNFIARKNQRSAAFDVNGQEMIEHFGAVDRPKVSGGQKEPTGKKPSFKEMNIEERIDFLMNRPFYVPSSPCEIQTERQSYFGFIEKYDGTEMVLRDLEEKSVSIPRKEVLAVLLMRM